MDRLGTELTSFGANEAEPFHSERRAGKISYSDSDVIKFEPHSQLRSKRSQYPAAEYLSDIFSAELSGRVKPVLDVV